MDGISNGVLGGMGLVQEITGEDLRQMFILAASILEDNKAGVNALNVFPVPDGDTGTNMSLTLASAVREMEKVPGDGVGQLAQAAALGSLMGARGNSGVILSQILRGFARGLDGLVRAGAREMAWALQEGVHVAYKAVMKPTEGTILTVAREAARVAVEGARRGLNLREVLTQAYEEAERTLALTPEMLPILKKNGVVDAGGKGLVYILSGFLSFLRGAVGVAPAEARVAEFEFTEELADIKNPYDTEFFIRGEAIPVEEVREKLGGMGDSLIVVGTPDLVKVHIHTQNPGQVLDYCLKAGELTQIEIKNMRDQHEELKERATGGRIEPASGLRPKTTLVISSNREDQAAREDRGQDEVQEIGLVAVASGQGIADTFRSLGAHGIVAGGQTMNPSTQEILQVVEALPYDRVVVLPNNKNIVLTAEQAGHLSGKKVKVVPTRSIPQGLAALLSWRHDLNLEANLDRMRGAAEAVKTGEVTYAIRNSGFQNGKIAEGDILGLIDGEIAVTGQDTGDVLLRLVETMVEPEVAIVTVFYGEMVEREHAAELEDRLKTRFPELEIEMHYGGQPIYYFLVSVE
ncbi:MAG: DAK2 domain-containing protein [Firmicutes bacterium]|nr:DAK2 domain-containing protein [Bacillota bacterium]